MQEAFLQRLAAALATLNDTERARIIDYYREMICDGVESGKDEQEVISGFGTPQEIAAQILEESRTVSQEGVDNLAVPADSDAYIAQGPLHSIVLDARHTNVEVRQVQSGPVQIHFTPTERDHVTVNEQNGVFSFHHIVNFPFFNFRYLLSAHRIVVDIPITFCGELHVSTCNAKLSVQKLNRLSTVQLTTSNGRLTVSDVDCGSLSLKTSNAPLELQNLNGGGCTVETSNGHITANACSFPDELYLYTSNAAIRAQSVISDHIEFTTSNGAVSAVILGDMREYAIRSHTSNASNTLPPELIFPDQKKHLNVSTNNARINVRFTPRNV